MTDNTKRIIMCGSRTWASRSPIYRVLTHYDAKYGADLTVIHGDEPNGADELIRQCCEMLDIRHEQYCAGASKYPAHSKFTVFCVASWNTQGKGAGMIRNKAMLDNSAIGCVAFRANGKSNGTDNMMRICLDRRIPVVVYRLNGRRTIADYGILDMLAGKDLI
jgi:hypothetical protein